MLRRTLLFVGTAAVFALIGWEASRLQMTKIPHKGQQCADDNCKVMVMVESFPSCGLTCDVFVNYELTEAKGHNITWEIDAGSTPRYEFAQKGVDFPSGFSCQQDGKKYKCKNLNPSVPGVYKYTINVTDTAHSKDLDPLDPWVVNN
jgi:hypothetical protein